MGRREPAPPRRLGAAGLEADPPPARGAGGHPGAGGSDGTLQLAVEEGPGKVVGAGVAVHQHVELPHAQRQLTQIDQSRAKVLRAYFVETGRQQVAPGSAPRSSIREDPRERRRSRRCRRSCRPRRPGETEVDVVLVLAPAAVGVDGGEVIPGLRAEVHVPVGDDRRTRHGRSRAPRPAGRSSSRPAPRGIRGPTPVAAGPSGSARPAGPPGTRASAREVISSGRTRLLLGRPGRKVPADVEDVDEDRQLRLELRGIAVVVGGGIPVAEHLLERLLVTEPGHVVQRPASLGRESRACGSVSRRTRSAQRPRPVS